MAEELKERKAFEAHMRVGGHSNHDKHPDGSYVSSAMELWWQGWKARAQLPRQGGEAVGEVRALSDGKQYAALYTMAGQHLVGEKLYTHPADQVAEGVRLDGLVLANLQMGRVYLHFKTTDQQHAALRELRALLNGGRS